MRDDNVKHRLRTVLPTAIAVLLLTGCGGSESSGSNADGADGDSAGETTGEPAAPEYKTLPKPALTKALLGVQDLPPGYAQDPPSAPTPNKTFCDYKPPFNEKVKVSREFTKGAGLSSEILSVGLRQYANTKQAQKAFTALTDALETCTGETYEGEQLTYAALSAPKVGDGSVGVKISADNYALLQNFALVGPTLVSTGGGGLMNANADELASLLKTQVKAYKSAAGQ